MCVVFTISAHHFSKFTPDLWDEYPRQRVEMLEDFKQRYINQGITRYELIKLLGEPYETSQNRIDYSFGTGSISFYINNDGNIDYVSVNDYALINTNK